MANEPQRPSEELLQAWAAQRRAEGGTPELHPATRRMLQGEVARIHGPAAAPAEAKRRWFAGWWPRLALAGSTLAAMVALVLALWPERASRTQFARSQMSSVGSIERKDSLLPADGTITIGGRGLTERVEAKAVGSALPISNTSTLAADALGVRLEPAAVPDRTVRTSHALGDDIALEAERMAASKTAPASASYYYRAQSIDALSPMLASPAERDRKTANLKAIPTGVEVAMNEKRKLGQEPVGPGESSLLKEAQLTGQSAGEKMEVKKTDFAVAANQPASGLPALVAAAPAPSPVSESAQMTFRAGDALANSPEARALGARADEAPGVAGQTGAVNTQRFTQADSRARLRRNFNSPATPDVLNTFQFEQTGLDVRITDGDGSVYLGKIVSVQSGAATAGVSAGKADAVRQSAAPQPAPANQSILFRVQGTNRASQQRLEFEGSLLLPLDRRAQLPQQLRGALSNQAPVQNFAPGAEIQGRAFIGRDQIEVRANATP